MLIHIHHRRSIENIHIPLDVLLRKLNHLLYRLIRPKHPRENILIRQLNPDKCLLVNRLLAQQLKLNLPFVPELR